MKWQFFCKCGGSAWAEKEEGCWIIKCDRDDEHTVVNPSYSEAKWEWQMKFGVEPPEQDS